MPDNKFFGKAIEPSLLDKSCIKKEIEKEIHNLKINKAS